MEKKRSEKRGDLITPKIFRRKERAIRNAVIKRRNDGKAVNSINHTLFRVSGDFNPLFLNYIQRRKKLKGWQRENRKYRKAA
jgi:hypothetical protein